jgi:hypothetical protein
LLEKNIQAPKREPLKEQLTAEPDCLDEINMLEYAIDGAILNIELVFEESTAQMSKYNYSQRELLVGVY